MPSLCVSLFYLGRDMLRSQGATRPPECQKHRPNQLTCNPTRAIPLAIPSTLECAMFPRRSRPRPGVRRFRPITTARALFCQSQTTRVYTANPTATPFSSARKRFLCRILCCIFHQCHPPRLPASPRARCSKFNGYLIQLVVRKRNRRDVL